MKHSGLPGEHAFGEACLPLMPQASDGAGQMLVPCPLRGAVALDQPLHVFEPYDRGLAVETEPDVCGVASVDVSVGST